MSLNNYQPNASLGTFTLEDLGLGQPNPDPNLDHVDDQGVLGYVQPNSPEAVIVADGASPGPHDTSLSESEIEAIPTWDAKIRILKEHADKIVDMKEVQKDIEGSGKINRRHSDVIEATFEHFYNARNIAGMYTTFESMTNFTTAQQFMAKKIKASMEAFVTEYEAVNTSVASEMAEDLLSAREFCIYELRDMLNESIEKFQAVCPRLCQGPIVLPFKDDQFLDMTSEDFTKIDVANIDISVPLSKEFIDSYNKMVALWKANSKLRNFVNEAMACHRKENPDSITPNVFDGLYLATLVTSFGPWASDVMYSEYVQSADRDAQDIHNLQQQIQDAVQRGGKSPDTIVSDRGGELVQLATQAAAMKGSARDLGEFAKAAACVAVGLASLR